MDWFSFWLNAATIAGQGVLLLWFTGRFTGKRLQARHFAVFLPSLYAAAIAPRLFGLQLIGIVLELLLVYAMARWILGNSRLVSCVTTFVAVYVAFFSTGIISPLEMLLFPYALGNARLLYILTIMAMLFGFAVCVSCYCLVLKQLSFPHNGREPYLWLLLTPCLFAFTVQLYLSDTAYNETLVLDSYQTETGKHLALLALQALGLGALLSALYAYQRTCESFQTRAALASLTQETHAQKSYVTEAQLRYERTRAFRHDLKNHLSVLSGLLKAGDTDQAQSYLQKLDAVTGDLSFPVHTNHPVMDILLGEKLELAQAQGTKAELSLSLPRPCAVEDFDLCVIFANALDNAIHACARIDGPSRIRIAGVRQGDFYMLEFENSCPSNLTQPPAMGTGLSNVKAVAEKYGGTISVEKTHSLFRLNVLLNISLQPDGSSRPNA